MRKRIADLVKNDFVRGGTALMIGSQIANVLNYLFNIFVARSVGPTGYGEIATLTAYLTIGSVPMSVLSTVVTQRIASHTKDTKIYGLHLFQRFVDFLPFVVVGTVFGFLITPYLSNTMNISIASVITLIVLFASSFIATFFNATLSGLQAFITLAIIGVTGATIKVSGSVIAFLGLGDINTILLFLALSGVYLGLIAGFIGIKRIGAIPKPTAQFFRILSLWKNRQIQLTTSALLMVTLLNNIDIVLVKKYFPETEAGIYSSWALLAKIIVYLTGPLIPVLFVFFSRHQKAHGTKTVIALLTSFALLFIGSFVSYSLFGSYLLTFFFGNRFNDALPYVWQAGIFGPLYTIMSFLNTYFLSQTKYLNRSLLLIPVVVIQFIGIMMFHETIDQIISVNIVVGSISAIIYLIAYLQIFTYNRAQKP